MPNIATVLKSEIARVARKEIRLQSAALKKATTTYRSEIAALKRRAQALEQQIRVLSKQGARAAPAAATEPATTKGMRFSAKGLMSQRKRLGLSAREISLLLGTSAQTIYNWEQGSARPRARHMQAIAALKTLGRKAAAAHIGSLETEQAK